MIICGRCRGRVWFDCFRRATSELKRSGKEGETEVWTHAGSCENDADDIDLTISTTLRVE